MTPIKFLRFVVNDFPQHSCREPAAREEKPQPHCVAIPFPGKTPDCQAQRPSGLLNPFIDKTLHEFRKAINDRFFALRDLSAGLQITGTPKRTARVNVEFIAAALEFAINTGDRKKTAAAIETGAVTG